MAARSKGVGLRPLARWDCGFESHRRHWRLSVVSVVCCQVGVSATDWSLLPTVARRCVWSRNLENEEAKARYGAVKIQQQWVVTPGKYNNKHYNITHPARGELSYLAPLGSENISSSVSFRQSNTTPPSPKTEITNIKFYILNFASIIKFKM